MSKMKGFDVVITSDTLWSAFLITVGAYLFVKYVKFAVEANIEYQRELKNGKIDKEKDKEESNMW